MVQHKHRHVARLAEPEAAPAVQTLVSVVYVTASPTFTGAIGGYTTIGVDPTTTEAAETTPTTTAAAETTAKTTTSVPSSILADTSSTTSAKTTALAVSSSSSVPTVILAPSTTASTTLSSAILVASSTSALSIASSKTSATTSSTASSTAAADSSASSGMSTGGKVGLAFGIMCLIGVALSLVLFFFKKRKEAAKQHERIDDEKNDIFAANSGGRAPSTRTARTGSTAPRLSLRPVTQFTPNLAGEKRPTGNGPNMAGSPQTNLNQSRRLSPGSAYNRPQAGQEANRNNPFGNHAETIDSTNANGPTIVGDMSAKGEIVPAGVAPGTAATSAGAIAVPTAAGLVRGASKRGNGPKPMDLTKPNARGPPSPAGTEFSFTEVSTPTAPGPQTPQQSQGGAAIAAAGGPPNSTVHRVQLDFKPSMDDELELTAGQLIRVLHEYDDGWALCIRLDRSQQGVVPRTCLSTRPVKPRPQQNGPRGPQGPPGPGMRGPQQQRPMSPAMNQGPPRPMMQNGNPNRPMTPNGGPQQRPMTPNGNQNRPMTPNGGPQQPPPMTPTAQGRARSPSVAQMQAPRSSPGPSPMKPQPEIPQTASASRPSTPTIEEAPQSPPAPVVGSVPRKPVGQAL